jgi:hypothetical protein
MEKLAIDLKAVKTAREVSISVFHITYERKSKRKVICFNILTKVTSL